MDGDGVLNIEEWLKFSEPLRLMPANAFLTLFNRCKQVCSDEYYYYSID